MLTVKIEYRKLFLQEGPRWVTAKGEELDLKWIRVDWSKPGGTQIHQRPALSDRSDPYRRPRIYLCPDVPRTPFSTLEIVHILSTDGNGVEHLDKDMPEVPLSLRGMEDELTSAWNNKLPKGYLDVSVRYPGSSLFETFILVISILNLPVQLRNYNQFDSYVEILVLQPRADQKPIPIHSSLVQLSWWRTRRSFIKSSLFRFLRWQGGKEGRRGGGGEGLEDRGVTVAVVSERGWR